MQNGLFHTGPMRVLVALTLLMVIIALGSYATLNFTQVDFLNPSPAVISVSGEGEVTAVPDIGQFSFSVNAEGEDVVLVQEESGAKINAILAYLAEQGIEDKDVKTQNYNLYPRWRYEERLCEGFGYCPPGKQVQDGFEVNQTVSVKVRDTQTAGTIIAGVGERGATNISGLNFTIDDPEALQAEARALAIADAQEQAVLLAKQLNVRVVRIVNFSEDGRGYYPQPFETKAMAFDMAEESASVTPDLPVGEQTTRAQVSITYQVE